MAIRMDHSFGLDPKYMILYYDKENVMPREHRQIKMIRNAKLHYDKVLSNKTFVLDMPRDTANALIDEMFGKGHFKPEDEQGWLVLAHADAQIEAVRLCEEKVVMGGLVPVFIDGEELIDTDEIGKAD